MDHLKTEEIIDFVSFDKLNDATIKLASRVNTHICRCDECLRRVRAFQTVYDEFVRMGKLKELSRESFEQAEKEMDEKVRESEYDAR